MLGLREMPLDLERRALMGSVCLASRLLSHAGLGTTHSGDFRAMEMARKSLAFRKERGFQATVLASGECRKAKVMKESRVDALQRTRPWKFGESLTKGNTRGFLYSRRYSPSLFLPVHRSLDVLVDGKVVRLQGRRLEACSSLECQDVPH